jgi:Cdc6-like AAA superfamily ATPase
MDKKTMTDWFFMRSGFDTFLLEPTRHARYLFGKDDRRQRDHLVESLEEAGYSHDGYKAAVYGDYGRGKTHQCLNLVRKIHTNDLAFVPVYFKCGSFKKKEPFNSLFRSMILGHTVDQIAAIASEYQHRVNAGSEPPLVEAVLSEDIANVMAKGLTAPNPEAVKTSMRWLAGDPKIDLSMLGGSLKPQLTDSADFGAVMRGFSQLFIRVLERVPLYIIDEAERLQNVSETDTYWGWLAALRELTEIHGIAMLFMVGAKTRDDVPVILVQPEIMRRIGVANYIEFHNPGRDDLRGFLLEQLQTTIRKGPVPDTQTEAVEPEALDVQVPEELRSITGDDPRRLETYPFEPDAFDEFLSQIAGGEMANKPSEAQHRLQKAAKKVMRLDERVITTKIVESLISDSL